MSLLFIVGLVFRAKSQLFPLILGNELRRMRNMTRPNDGRESEWTPGVGDGQGGLACCDSQGRKESDMTERLNWTELNVLLGGLESPHPSPSLPFFLSLFLFSVCGWVGKGYWINRFLAHVLPDKLKMTFLRLLFSYCSWSSQGKNQSILKETNPEYSLEGLMLKLKLQLFGHLMWRADSLE